MARQPATVAELLRTAIDDWCRSGRKRSNYRLAELSGVAESEIWRFRRGDKDVKTATVDRLLEAMELEASFRRRARPARKTTPAGPRGPAGALASRNVAADEQS